MTCQMYRIAIENSGTELDAVVIGVRDDGDLTQKIINLILNVAPLRDGDVIRINKVVRQ